MSYYTYKPWPKVPRRDCFRVTWYPPPWPCIEGYRQIMNFPWRARAMIRSMMNHPNTLAWLKDWESRHPWQGPPVPEGYIKPCFLRGCRWNR